MVACRDWRPAYTQALDKPRYLVRLFYGRAAGSSSERRFLWAVRQFRVVRPPEIGVSVVG